MPNFTFRDRFMNPKLRWSAASVFEVVAACEFRGHAGPNHPQVPLAGKIGHSSGQSPCQRWRVGKAQVRWIPLLAPRDRFQFKPALLNSVAPFSGRPVIKNERSGHTVNLSLAARTALVVILLHRQEPPFSFG